MPSSPPDDALGRPQQQRRRQVCLFGTSANPPTGQGGHLGVVQALVDLQRFDAIWIVPVYQHMFATKRTQLIDFEHRMAMCHLAVKELVLNKGDNCGDNRRNHGGLTEVVVSAAEKTCFDRLIEKAKARVSMEDTSSTEEPVTATANATTTTAVSSTTTDKGLINVRVGTADLLEMLQEEEVEADTDFSFCLGADTFLDLTAWKWKRSQDVLRLLDRRLVVVHRKRMDDVDDDDEHDDNIRYQQQLQERIDFINSDTSLSWSKEENTDTNDVRGRVELLNVPSLSSVSSSMARGMKDEQTLRTMLSPGVVDYIKENKLYSFGEARDHDTNSES